MFVLIGLVVNRFQLEVATESRNVSAKATEVIATIVCSGFDRLAAFLRGDALLFVSFQFGLLA